MALLPGAADPAMLALARNALARLWARGARGPLVVHERPLEQLHLAAPHPVFDLTLDDVVAGRGLESAHRSGLRLLVLAGDRAVAAVELVPGSPWAHRTLGQVLLAKAKDRAGYEDAVDELRQANAKMPGDPVCAQALGQAHSS